jgi:hypothetical protein
MSNNKQQTTLPAQKFLRILADGQLTSSDSITRMRRKAQEEHPELRGAKYNQRQDRQSSGKKDLGYGQSTTNGSGVVRTRNVKTQLKYERNT